MSEIYHAPLKLTSSYSFPGFQFYARVEMDGLSNQEVFHYIILSVYNWIKDKVPDDDSNAKALQIPLPDQYQTVEPRMFIPFHTDDNSGFQIDITPLIESGIWTLRLRHPDTGVDDRPAVIGRAFTTRVGVRLSDKGYVELGVRTDVIDHASTDNEPDYVFRPLFIKDLAKKPFVTFKQISDLRYAITDRIETDEDYKRLLYTLDNEDNQLPLVIFTYARPGKKSDAKNMNMEDLVKSDQIKSLLQFSGSQMPGIGKAFPGMMPGSPAAPSVLPNQQKPPVLPYDTDTFSRSMFAYALTFALNDKYTEKFRSRIKKDFNPGDILLCGARRFRGGVHIIGYPGENERDLKKVYENAKLVTQGYIKHKEPYDYGTVVFESEARNLAREKEIDRILESEQLEEKEKKAELAKHVEEQKDVIKKKDEKISRLEKQCEEEFDRGIAFKEEENAKLESENNRLKKELADKQSQIDHMQSSYQQAKWLNSAVDELRSVSQMPETREDVVRYFMKTYRDRIDFTERGQSTASKCELKASSLWNILYVIANGMVDLYRNSSGNLLEKDIQECTGLKASFGEGSMTRENADMMRQREDVYNGKTISVEPHLKLKAGKEEKEKQRLHFWYDPDNKRIVISYIGEHLDSASSRYVK